jgi:hypothetical protein
LLNFRPEGITFVVEPDSVLIPTPRVGAVVSFSYETQARREEPVAPAIFRVRSDVSWEDVLVCAARETGIPLSSHLVFSLFLF